MQLKAIFKSDVEKIKRIILKSDFKKLAKMIDGEEWLANSEPKDMVGLGIAIVELGLEDDIDVYLVDADTGEKYDDFNHKFQHKDILKKIFLMDLSERWTNAQAIRNAINTFKSTEVLENKYNKGILSLTEEEATESLEEMYHGGYFGLQFKIKVLSNYEKFFKDYVEKPVWAEIYSARTFVNKVSHLESVKDTYITNDNLIDLFSIQENSQVYIIPLLIFHGVCYSRVEEVDELAHLSIDDIGKDFINIRSGKYPRKIPVDPILTKLIKQAYNQSYINRYFKHTVSNLELKHTKYILRAVEKGSNESEEVMAYRGIYQRLIEFKEQFESIYGVQNASVRLLVSSGKKYWIDRYLADGLELQDAIRKTLKRFGEWTVLPDPDRENGLQANRQRVIRTKKVWRIYNIEYNAGQEIRI